MELREAAAVLGVHYTTLRRWTDSGRVPSVRTPGGRRRFRRDALDQFLKSLQHGGAFGTALAPQPETRLIALLPDHSAVTSEPWYDRLDSAQRTAMRRGGHELLAVLMQYTSRSNGGEPFLSEGRRLAATYGRDCQAAGLSLAETVRASLSARRAIKDALYSAGSLAGAPDAETLRLYERMTTFMDQMLITTVEAYDLARLQAPPVH